LALRSPHPQNVKYLGLTLDRRLAWAHHIKSKTSQLTPAYKCSKLNIKLLHYKSLLKPIRTYGLQLWGNAKISNLNKIQRFQNKILRKITDSPPYVSNHSLHKDLHMKTIQEAAKNYYKRFRLRLNSHPSELIKNLASLTIPGNPPRRLKRKWCRDLLNP